MAAIWAIADLHLSFGVPNKAMDIFGEQWLNHPEKVKKHWEECIDADDLVLLAGDLSWAKDLEEAMPDLEWIDALPGTKVILRGNHDYWWSTLSKLKKALPPTLNYIQNNVFNWKGVSIGGARLWDSSEYNFNPIIHVNKPDSELPLNPKDADPERDEKIFSRELLRLENSLKLLEKKAKHRIAMTHYPPIGLELAPSRASTLLEKYHVDTCVFGHLHNVKEHAPPPFGKSRGIEYLLTAADFLDFKPQKILDNL